MPTLGTLYKRILRMVPKVYDVETEKARNLRAYEAFDHQMVEIVDHRKALHMLDALMGILAVRKERGEYCQYQRPIVLYKDED